MFARSISIEEVKQVIKDGEIVQSYADDKPYPSFLIMKVVASKVLHAVVARNDDDGSCILVTVYEPDQKIWNTDFKSKR